MLKRKSIATRILNRVWSALQSCWNDPHPGISPSNIAGWTKRIALAIRTVARQINKAPAVLVFGHGLLGGEYLVDQVWSIEGRKRTDYRGLLLAMECELSSASDDDRWYDFVKVADVRADLRVFIGAFPASAGMDDMKKFVTDVQTMVSRHRHRTPSDLYLLALYFKGGRTDGQLHGFVVGGDGSRRDL